MAAVARLPPLPTIGDIVRMYNLGANRALSQNFLLDMGMCRKIAKAAGPLTGAYVFEVGPGPGGITRALLEQDIAKLIVVEKDRRFLPGLNLLADASNGRMEVVQGDVLQYDFSQASIPNEYRHPWHDRSPNVFIFGNLPFNVATPLIIRFLRAMSERDGPFSYGRTRLALTFQKEVGERMVAPIVGSQRCRLSAMCQYLADVKMRFIINGNSFVPKPKVDAALMHFTPLDDPKIKLPFVLVEKFCRHLFHYRRSYCRSSIRTLFPQDVCVELADEILRRARVSPVVPCTKISVEEIRDMCHVYDEICRRIPGMFFYEYRKKQVTLDDIQKNNEILLPPSYPFQSELSDTL